MGENFKAKLEIFLGKQQFCLTMKEKCWKFVGNSWKLRKIWGKFREIVVGNCRHN